MCKLYLVLAILSSVTLFVHHFKRCNVMSTIKTQNDTGWLCLVWFCLISWHLYDWACSNTCSHSVNHTSSVFFPPLAWIVLTYKLSRQHQIVSVVTPSWTETSLTHAGGSNTAMTFNLSRHLWRSLLLCIKSAQLRWFRKLIRMHPGYVRLEVLHPHLIVEMPV